MASNFLDILSQLHDHHVDFVIVGGVAAALHGGSRVTFDLDLGKKYKSPKIELKEFGQTFRATRSIPVRP